jgi:hypothetical protein
MNTPNLAKKLLEDATSFHALLVEQARTVAKIRDILEFIVECISFAEAYLPPDAISSWTDGSVVFGELSKRTKPIYSGPVKSIPVSLGPVYTTSGSAATGTFAMLTDNFKYLEDNESRSKYVHLAGKYRSLISGPEEQSQVHAFLGPLDMTAQSKFNQSLKTFQSWPKDEDPQGPLLEMRSAIDLALDALFKLTPLSKSERGDLKKIAVLPTIAQHLAKDELAKIDLILANDRLEKLKSQLSASKQTIIPRIQAEALMSQAVAILNLIASTIKLPNNRLAG